MRNDIFGGIDLAEATVDIVTLMRRMQFSVEGTFEAMGKMADEQNGVWVLVKDEDMLPLAVAAAASEPESYWRTPRRRDEE